MGNKGITVVLAVSLGTLLLTGFAPVKPDFGLRVGNVWTYSQKSGDTVSTVTETAVRFVSSSQVSVLEVKADYSSGHQGYSYRGQSELGLLSYYNGAMHGPGVDWHSLPTVLVKMPFNKGLTWTWIEPFRGQTSGHVTAADIEKMKSYVTATIVAEDEELKVPAGTYKAMHVRVTSESDSMGKSVSDNWYVFGVGLVKSVTKSPEWTQERTLTAFTPGK